uniref:Low-density lipoprotein receptor-related protein 4-like n=1 Tax=Saccoglossus kowalevskii TaxID=10224 RepID=A0ABM0MYJ3_SACKO|nr:PREDICTED: low-density lipoprotein receptor-related protein 4-like [Saccoglossus kowalevskii]
MTRLTLRVSALFIIVLNSLVAVNAQTLLVANTTTIIGIDLSVNNNKRTIYSGIQRAVAVGVDYADNELFWSDVEERAIYRGSIDGQVAPIANLSDLGRPNGIAIDWITNHIYWTDGLYGTIDVADYNGDNRRTLLYSLSNPRSITLDPVDGIMFWTDQGSNTIESANMDGSNPQSLVNTGLYWPNEIVYDSQSKTLYWIDGYYHNIKSLEYGVSTTPTEVADLSTVSTDIMFGLGMIGNSLYFSVWNVSSIWSVIPGYDPVLVTSDGLADEVFGLAVSDASIQTETSNGCTNRSPSCSHICLPDGLNSGSCACPSFDELTLSSDGYSCELSDDFLLYCAGNDGQIRMKSLDGDPDGRSIVIDQTARCVALDYHPVQKVIYYSDVALAQIRKVNLDGSDSEVFLQKGIGIVDGLALDILHNRLYFTNWNMVFISNTSDHWARIEMIDLSGNNRKRIIDEDIYRPRAIILDVQAGYLYYTDWDVQPGIVRTDLDGKNRMVIQNTGVDNPNGIALRNDKMYWLDSHVDSPSPPTMEYSNLDGTNKASLQFPLKVPFGLDIIRNTQFYSDWNNTCIYKCTLDTGPCEKIVDDIIDPMGVKHATRTASNNLGMDRCAGSICSNSGGICVHVPGGTRCLCPDQSGLILDSTATQCLVPNNFLLVADVTDIQIISFDSSSQGVYPQEPAIQRYQDDNIVAVVYDPSNEMIYYSNVHTGVISRVSIQALADKPDEFYRGGGVIDGMAIDESQQLLYWTDYELKTIERMNLFGDTSTHELIISGLDSPRAITLHNGYVYWTEWGIGYSKVQRLNLFGYSIPPDILPLGNLEIPNGLAIEGDKLYVIDGGRGIVIKSDLNGYGKETIDYLTGRFNHAYGLAVMGNTLIFSSWEDKAVFMTNTVTRRFEKIAENMLRPTAVVLHATGGATSCNCTDDCEPIPGGYQCVCSIGMIFDDDMRTCVTCSDVWDVTDDTKCSSDCHGNADCAENLCSLGNYNCVCRAGYQGDGVSTCTKCGVDHFKDHLGTADCEACPEHLSTSGQDGQTTCNCDPGYVMENGFCIEEAEDQGQSITCEFAVKVNADCGDLNAINGALSCDIAVSSQCILHCYDGYASSTETYNCVNRQWRPTDQARCSRIRGQNGQKTLTFSILTTCQNIETLWDDVLKVLASNLDKHNLCHIQGKRVCSKNNITLRCGNNNRNKRDTDNVVTVEMVIEITSEEYILDDEEREIQQQQMENELNAAANRIEEFINNGSLVIEVDGQTFPAEPESFSVTEVEWYCMDGYIQSSSQCNACPSGAMYNPDTNTCIDCPFDTYQSKEAQLECTPCEDNTHTVHEGSFKQSQCVAASSEEDSQTPIIIGAVVGIVLLIVVVVVTVLVCRRRKSSQEPIPGTSHASNIYEDDDFELKLNLKRTNTAKLHKAMFEHEDTDYSAIPEKDSNYMELNKKDIQTSEYEALHTQSQLELEKDDEQNLKTFNLPRETTEEHAVEIE